MLLNKVPAYFTHRVVAYLENSLVKLCKKDFMLTWSSGLSPNNYEQVFHGRSCLGKHLKVK